MPAVSDFPAIGKVLNVHEDAVWFQPQGTNYELRLATSGRLDVPTGERLQCLIRATARKLWTVPSGGNFITPIFGPPRIVQGRVKYLDDAQMVVQAGAAVIVELPKTEAAFDLASGSLRVGALVNASLLPGASIEVLKTVAVG